jgi:hypothetical protein
VDSDNVEALDAYRAWLAVGIEQGFCSEPFCNTHDGYPMHSTEEDAWEEGWDPCCHAVRLGQPEDWAVGPLDPDEVCT